MRILQTIETHGPGGAESVLLDLAMGSATAHGNEAHGFFIKEGWLPEQFKQRDLPVTMGSHDYTLDFPLVSQLVRAIRRERIDLIHAHELRMGFFCALASRLTRTPCVVTLHGKHGEAIAGPVRKRIYGRALGWTRRVAVSYDLRAWLVGQYGMREDSITVIHNGIRTASFHDEERSEAHRGALREELGIPPGAIVCATVGRLYAVKNYGLLLDAAARLVRRADGLHFVIVGDGPERAAIEGTVRDRLMADRVHVLGERADVPRILAGSDMFVLTSHSEGLSIAILEAMASGLAVVATDVGDNRHLIADEEQGFLVAPGDGDALAERILTLCSDPEQMRRMGASARGKAQSRFEHARMLEDYSRVYDEAIRGV